MRTGPSEHALMAERLFEHVGDMVCLLDAQGRFTWINPAGLRLTGFAADELVGKPATELIAPELRDRAARQFLDRLRGRVRPHAGRVGAGRP